MPVLALARFERFNLKAGETKTVSFILDSRALSTVNPDGSRSVKAGKIDVWLGGGQPATRKGLVKASGVGTWFTVTSNDPIEP